MPLLVLVDVPERDVGQGDLLRDVRLFFSGHDGAPQIQAKCTHALVVSRDCVGANKPCLVVAPVFAEALELEHEKDPGERFEKLQKKLSLVRDGGNTPDRFYLGSLETGGPRLMAHLDELCTLRLPEASQRSKWLGDRRVATLHPDLKAALPVRLFWAFGRTGFDDMDWYPTEDLRAIVDAGEAQRLRLEGNVKDAESLLNLTSGKEPNAVQGARREVEKRQEALDTFAIKVVSFREELERRTR